jgi:hypothetical protein
MHRRRVSKSKDLLVCGYRACEGFYVTARLVNLKSLKLMSNWLNKNSSEPERGCFAMRDLLSDK